MNTLERLVYHTEMTLFGGVQAKRAQTPMWLNLDKSFLATDGEFLLRPAASEEDWLALKNLRAEIEVPFGVTNPDEIERLIVSIRKIVCEFKADWYMAYFKEELVGEVGLVEFKVDGLRYGRLLDVDIAPRFQGRGLGNQLIWKIAGIAKAKGLEALALKADSDRWVKNWYTKLGFESVGAWVPR